MAGLYRQNNISSLREAGIDLGPRWEKILNFIVSNSSFSPEVEKAKQIQWWKTNKIGSVSVPGVLIVSGEPVYSFLKIQGSKPRTSEFDMISEFANQNESRVIRPPIIYQTFPWDEGRQFEAFIQEKLPTSYSIVNHPATDFELNRFFQLYEEYRANCRSAPWLAKPQVYSYQKNIDGWLTSVKKDREKDQYSDSGDKKLMVKAIDLIKSKLSVKDLEFVHGHIAVDDFRIGSKSEVVLKSNLFWGWRVPFYDIAFGYHWWMLGMEHARNLDSDLLEKERKRWLDKIYNLTEMKGNQRNQKLVTLALLERAVPALMVDRFMMNQTKPSAEIITKGARKELKRLLKEFS